MKIQTKTYDEERTILIGMIVDKNVLARLEPKWADISFRSPWAVYVATWCIKYFKSYKKAPGSHIQSIYETWASEKQNKDRKEIIGQFLDSLNKQYKKLRKESNSDYVVDLAGTYFNKVKLERLAEDITNEINLGHLDKAIAKTTNYRKLEVGTGSWIDVFGDEERIKAAFDERHDSLITYPDGLGEFFGDRLERDGFIAFVAPDKRGKCVQGDMEVMLANGKIKTIEDIVKNKIKSPVLTLNEKTQKVEKVKISDYWDNGKKICWELITKTGRKSRTTINHKYLTPDGWKDLKNIKIGDFIAVPKVLNFFGNKSLPENEIKFLAYMLAEGGCTVYQPTFTNTDPILIKDFEDSCKGLGIKYRRKGISNYLLGANNLRRKYPEALWMVKSINKKIPEAIFTCPKEQIALFLRIFFSCDGCIYKGRNFYQIELSLGDDKMIKQISYLLTRFGIVHSLRNRKVKCNGKEFLSYGIEIRSQEYVNKFITEIGFMSYKNKGLKPNKLGESFLDKIPNKIATRFYEELKQEWKDKGFYKTFGRKNAETVKYQINKGCNLLRRSFRKAEGSNTFKKYINSDILWDEVTSIKNIGIKQTYDIAIPEHHNFVAENCFIHNSFWLLELAFRGVLQRRKVAFFECGDLSEHQIMRRFMVRVSKHPEKPCKVRCPTKIKLRPKLPPLIKFKYKTFKKKLSWQLARKHCKLLTDGKNLKNLLRLSCYSNDSLSVENIRNTLDEWAKDNWVPDIVIIDYADILNMDYYGLEGRDRINHCWKQLRRLSQELHCLVATATQSDTDAYDAKIMGQSNFSEDKRKNAHVTGMIGINQSAKEKEAGYLRLNWIVLREGFYSPRRCCYVATCLELANMAVRSRF